MEPLVALVGTTCLALIIGACGVHRLRRLPTALRGGLAVMFLLTGGAHFIGMRDELVAMVPPALPARPAGHGDRHRRDGWRPWPCCGAGRPRLPLGSSPSC